MKKDYLNQILEFAHDMEFLPEVLGVGSGISDFNTAPNGPFYTTTQSAANQPNTGYNYYFTGYTWKISNSAKNQMAVCFDARKIFVRQYLNGAWSEWGEI